MNNTTVLERKRDGCIYNMIELMIGQTESTGRIRLMVS